MLVLTRKRGQSIFIGDGIEVVVLESRNDRVRLGFIAPAEVPIVREEIRKPKPWQEPASARRPRLVSA